MAPPDEALVPLLAEWLPRQRWFGGKDRPVIDVSIGTVTELLAGDPTLYHLVVDVRQDAAAEGYQVLLGVRRHLPDRLAHAEIGHLTAGDEITGVVYDAVHDPELTRLLLERMAGEDAAGPLRFRRAPGAELRTDLTGLPTSAEQSNTSLIFDGRYILKLFRRLSPGVNPDLEVNLALTRRGSAHVPAVHGWIELEPEHGPDHGPDHGSVQGPDQRQDRGDEPVTLAMLSEFLRSATDGWQLAITSVRDWFALTAPPDGTLDDADVAAAGGDFAAEAERLGAATAEVHRDLAQAFGVTEASADEVRALALRMHEQLDEVARDVAELRPYAGAIRTVFDELAGRAAPLPFQRVHGDYHLGQVLRTDSGWVLLDFEGEPARTPGERRALAHPLRDVAGMLRSFEYAARFLLAAQERLHPDSAESLERRAQAWAAHNRAAFCAGYVAAGGTDPDAHSALVKALEFEKAVYEIRYEAKNRPAWLAVPLRSLAHLTA